MKRVVSLIAGALLLSAQAVGLAQAYPSKPVKVVVPLAAGGTGDTLARTVGDGMARELGQSVVIDNRPGAGGLLGTTSVLNAPADGYTLLAVSPSHVINPALHAGSTYDPLRDFEPITVLAYTHQVIAAHPSVPASNLRELIAYAKNNPGKLNYGSAGTGSATHLNMELLKSMAGVDIVHVPYKGSTQARQGVLAGEVQLAVDGLLPLQPLIKDGRLKVIAVTSSRRPQSNPEIPTVGETLPGYASDTWYGLLARSGTPREAISRLHQAAVKALQSPAVREGLTKLGADPAGNTPAEFRAFLAEEQKLWGKVLKDSGVKPQ
ncbi:Bug family tripartite tricarboxylate transporter substrate binding protein [Ramlibacter tataouinensis]|uniref:Candidate extracytoplasmic binding receptor n=1 Tax=Ramlibacter tataouinensis (strain ATCC BAA-407 / DSM 14655 / LMG 21543 / TTB310) TaxID=365046 RepID=F5Y4Y6_RAMTT|nr:tripartite tricarboxylate transporter substrate binding protein [Ramlibacter tataouinensis]AEG92642.1 Candidate extracytoplasmic binding receptor [Ramlibacter tataouinensis TTB310]